MKTAMRRHSSGGVDPAVLTAVYGDTYEYFNRSDYGGVFAAIATALSKARPDSQASIYLPYTGGDGIIATTPLELPSGQPTPNIYGWGYSGSIIKYRGPTDKPAIYQASPPNSGDYEWSGWALDGPGKSTSSDDGQDAGNGIQFGDGTNHSTNHNQRISVRVTNFPGTAIKIYGFFTGSITHAQVQHCGSDGIYIQRLNGGSINHSIVQGCARTQVTLEDSVHGVFGPGNDVDGGSDSAVGLQLVATHKRSGPAVLGNYFEGNGTHIDARSGDLPQRGVCIAFNRLQSGQDGLRLDGVTPNGHGGFVGFNRLNGLRGDGIILDGDNWVLGPNFDINIGVDRWLTTQMAGMRPSRKPKGSIHGK